MTVLTALAPYSIRHTADRDFLIGAAVLLAFLCCSILASLASDGAGSVLESSWTFFP